MASVERVCTAPRRVATAAGVYAAIPAGALVEVRASGRRAGDLETEGQYSNVEQQRRRRGQAAACYGEGDCPATRWCLAQALKLCVTHSGPVRV
jgi:hypothetical protein